MLMNRMAERFLQTRVKPVRLGFLGVGWIGRNRMEAILRTQMAEAVAIADPSEDMLKEALRLAPDAEIVGGLDALLSLDLDGVVIATPSALHTEQSIRVLQAGVAVFCQKPLGRSAAEAEAVVAAARSADRLLGVDLSYRYTEGMQRIRDLTRSGELGTVFAADLVFHNAYGPDKSWFYDKSLSGGGCVIDLGVHLIDMALWCLDFPEVVDTTSTLMKGGAPISAAGDVEDFAVATLAVANGAVIRLACSWRLQAGCDAVIGADFFGTSGGASFRNVGGSFYDFAAHRFRGTSTEEIVRPPDDWGGRAAADWAARLASGQAYDPSCERLVDVAEIIDDIYRHA
ncbi:Gfo/Idh/MocA family oxidoreductase [Rhizobium leguminosarum]|nr:Gfo/Idh/MocA family oxidoreductase [Rhizobium leguminosarum]MBY5639183.1 Gfo/Idh/MocA family oxidoreductase [Rhizobium leguminosarum]MBY5671066.1 Gfo/Idh/MocA family oxidoreductase [Rhizobium leguminosarum]MBY5683684.1 Gfo/Idh/MocA family oxidoreductase [Rhizobium leguminosarum]MBY5692810.1 Gfo/Idh/MocA family oxidoreductase [Rhizobium leguminosarum]